MIERASPSEQIAAALRAQIEAGELRPGDALPPDAELARRFAVSKPTVTKARSMLVALGLVSSRAGAASVVSEPEQQGSEPEPERARRTRRVLPAGHHTTVLSARLAPASPGAAAALGVDAGEPLIQRRHVTHAADQTPLATSTAYFPAALAETCPDLLQTRRIRQGTTRYVEQQTGRAASAVETALACVAADRRDSDALALAPASAVLVLATTVYDAAGAPLAHEVEIAPADHPIRVEIEPI